MVVARDLQRPDHLACKHSFSAAGRFLGSALGLPGPFPTAQSQSLLKGKGSRGTQEV
jgi:hypothetical protein